MTNFEKRDKLDYEIKKIEDKIIDMIVLISQVSNKLSIIIESVQELRKIPTVKQLKDEIR